MAPYVKPPVSREFYFVNQLSCHLYFIYIYIMQEGELQIKSLQGFMLSFSCPLQEQQSSRFSLKVHSQATPSFSVIFGFFLFFLRNHIFPPENDHTIKQHQQSLLQEARIKSNNFNIYHRKCIRRNVQKHTTRSTCTFLFFHK